MSRTMQFEFTGFAGRHAPLGLLPEPLQALLVAHTLRRTMWAAADLDQVRCVITMPGGDYELYEHDPDLPEGLEEVLGIVRRVSLGERVSSSIARLISVARNSNLRVRPASAHLPRA